MGICETAWLVLILMRRAKRFGCEVIEQFATDFVLKPGGPHEVLIGDKWFACDALILANGASARWLGATGEEKFVNRGISACATCDGPLPIFRNKHIYVVGGGDSACEEAAFLTRFASKVYMIHRRDKLRASKVMADRVLSNPKVITVHAAARSTLLANEFYREGRSPLEHDDCFLYRCGEARRHRP